ncbi:methyl-accepting chemotaxis protein [Candidatus Clostridium stratigraminis]|uniref:Methyl-accepting chemotaxis protein n=1 Tax=Candidatus Clostridium stratigraminis TaxID=3381661 RepID=A0ABW8T654_9CLOT
MKWFYNLKIASKLLIGFIIIAVIAGTVGVVGVINIKKIQVMDEEMYSWHTSTLDDMAKAMEYYQLERVNLRDAIYTKDAAQRQKSISQFSDLDKKISTSLSSFQVGIKDDKTLKDFNTLQKALEDYKAYRDKEISLANSNQSEQAISSLYSDGASIASAMENAINNLLDGKVSLAKQDADANQSSANQAVITMIIIIAIGVAIAIFLGIFISKIIGNPIKKMVSFAEEVASGNLDMKIEANTKDEVGVLMSAFDKMIETLHNLVSEQGKLLDEASKGNLNARGDEERFQGGYRDIIGGTNNLLDVVVNPINEAMQVIGKMSVNDYSLKMTEGHKGMLREFSDAINAVQSRLLHIQDIVVDVSQGDTSSLEELRKVGKRSDNDKIMPAIIVMMQNIKDLISEVETVSSAAVNGDLSLRGNSNKFNGGFKEILEGFNNTINAVVEPIREASEVLKEMADGNLTVGMIGDYKGEYARIKNDINATIKAFNEVLNNINNASQQVASGSNQVSDSAQTLSQGSTEQASSIEELTASIEEIAAQTKQNAGNANQANELSLSAKDEAVLGNNQMKEMLKAMEEINESSGNISKIIKVIDDIAFQTNILALNAAVEAARAGQHGKGFAVVAEEVRNLAARSADAAKETTALIENSIKKSDGGTKIANETASALGEIVDTVTKVAALVGEIAAASNEQAAGIAQINQGITQVSQVVQANSATSEECAAASEELSGQAETLKQLVGKFKLKKDSSKIKSLEELNPDVLRMLENMAERKKNRVTDIDESMLEAAITKPNIVLSDTEFGKY